MTHSVDNKGTPRHRVRKGGHLSPVRNTNNLVVGKIKRIRLEKIDESLENDVLPGRKVQGKDYLYRRQKKRRNPTHGGKQPTSNTGGAYNSSEPRNNKQSNLVMEGRFLILPKTGEKLQRGFGLLRKGTKLRKRGR